MAVVDAVYSVRPCPGVNVPNVAGAPSVSESVAGTVPPTPPYSSRTLPNLMLFSRLNATLDEANGSGERSYSQW